MTLRFDVYPDGAGVFEYVDASRPRVWEVIEGLQARQEAAKPAQHLRALKELVAANPMSLAAHLALADYHFDKAQTKFALAAGLAGLAVANRLIPESFSGRIEWGHLDNRPYLRLLALVGLAYSSLHRHRDAVTLIERSLALNPDDNMGLRYLLGSEALGAKDLAKAKQAYMIAAAERYPAACYQLGLLYVKEQAWTQAATALRQGFLANLYIAEALNGGDFLVEWPIAHASNFARIEFARDYFLRHGQMWRKDPEAVLFVRWLFNHSKVLAERATWMACLEALYWERAPNKRHALTGEYEKLVAGIDHTLSAELTVKRQDADGNWVYPWELIVFPESALF